MRTLLCLLLFWPLAAAADDLLPPRPLEIASKNCTISQVGGKDTTPGWYLQVRATYKNPEWPEWALLYGVYDTRRKALLACDDWMTELEKQQKKLLKEGNREKKEEKRKPSPSSALCRLPGDHTAWRRCVLRAGGQQPLPPGLC